MVEPKDLTKATLGVRFIVEYGLAGSLKVLNAKVLCILVVRIDERSTQGVRNHRGLHVRELSSEAFHNSLIGRLPTLLLLK